MDFFRSYAFADHVEALMLDHHVPGVSVAIVRGNGPAVARGFGYASMARNEPCTPETLFDVASLAKSLTAAAVALLVADNENHAHVQYDTPMSSLLPDDFVMSSAEHTRGATIDDLLSHRTGMAGHDDSYMGLGAAEPDTPRSITRNLRNLAVAAPLRSRYLYCNMMYTVATHLVQVESGQSFAEFLEQRIFEPLGMESTTLQPDRARERGLGHRFAQGHIWDKASETYRALECRTCPEGQGAGSIISSVDDFIKWVQALMMRTFPVTEQVYQGLVRMRSIVNPTGRRLKPHSSPALYAAGMEVYYYRGHEVIGHDGHITGFASRFVFLPGLPFGIVVMGNSAGAGAVCSSMIRVLTDDALHVPDSERHLLKKKKVRTKKSIPVRTKHSPRNAQTSLAEAAPTGRGGFVKTEDDRTGKLPETALKAYIGKYSNPGYHVLTVIVRDGRLFVDATDRSMGFTLTFEHFEDQSRGIAYLSDAVEGGSEPVDAKFIFQDGRVVRLGLDLEPAIRDLIWFDRLAASSCG
ncbi:D-aminopeptidase, putative [Cordyceps militaris CM01]|uniref:D-aminopeptidase, putative n=1 Tax=Cordyceps militaris (strain CM01) TaxID=983644 RepID=G3JT16_CORMM|nr:D-aminopeptidase, putative [Cordyceps militaris CM01]EGX89012.1 D-aminopeptidase, putative [Cordyceps militaris CM01]